MSAVSDIVDVYTQTGSGEAIATMRDIALNDPVLCRDIVEAIKRKMYCHVAVEQLRAVELLDRLMDSFDLTLFQVVHDKEFLSSLEKLLTRETSSPDLVAKTKKLFSKWVTKFAEDQDILPNFQTYHSRLVEQGLLEPLRDSKPNGEPKNDPMTAQVMDAYLINEAEGQDPEEFTAEVKETLKLFDEVYTTIVASTSTVSATDEVSRREALISLAANLDRYSEQFGLWIEQLEPGQYMEEAMSLNDKVTESLQKYKILRASGLGNRRQESSSDEDDSSSDGSSDEDSD